MNQATSWIAIDCVSIAIMLLLSYMISHNIILGKRTKQFFLYAIALTTIVIASEAALYFFERPVPGYRIPAILSNIIGFSLSPLIAIYMSYAFSINHKHNKWKNMIINLPGVINIIATVSSPLTGFIFSISADGIYSRGPLFFIYILSYLWGLIFFFHETRNMLLRFRTQNRMTLVFLFIFITGSTTIQVINPELRVSWFCIAVAIVLYYAYSCELSEKYDVMTEVMNRRAYETALEKARSSNAITFVFFDIDDFKQINDTYGHPFGDFVLRTVAQVLRESFKDKGNCFRIGGDEFCVMLPPENSNRLDETLCSFTDTLGKNREDDPRIPFVSFGYSTFDKSVETLESALNRADAQLYLYKTRRKEAELHV